MYAVANLGAAGVHSRGISGVYGGDRTRRVADMWIMENARGGVTCR